jgi:hypothetical protein
MPVCGTRAVRIHGSSAGWDLWDLNGSCGYLDLFATRVRASRGIEGLPRKESSITDERKEVNHEGSIQGHDHGPVEASAPTTVSSIRKWNEGTFSIWLLGPENKDGSLNIVYGVNQAQN